MCLHIHARTTLGMWHSLAAGMLLLSLADYVYINVILGASIPEVVPLDERTWFHLEILLPFMSIPISSSVLCPTLWYGRVK